MVHSSFAVQGGAERYLRDLSRALTLRGHEVRVFCRASPAPASSAPAPAEPTDHHVRDRLAERLARRVPRLRKLLTHLGDLLDPTGLRPGDLSGFAPDVVHVHNWQGLGVLPVARLAAAYPTCHTPHDHAICDPNNALGNLGRSRPLDALLAARSAWIGRRLRRAQLLFATERARARIRRYAPGPGVGSDRVVPLGVAPVGPRGSWPVGRRDTFLFLGALSPHKGVDLLLRVWRSAQPELGGRLLIAGDGPLRADVEAAAAALPSVRYLGYVDSDAKRSALGEAGWLVFPSQCTEMFPIACAEALLAGRPIIASAIAEPAMATPGSTLVFRTGAELDQQLTRAARMAGDEYRAMSDSAATAGTQLDWDHHVSTLVGIYEGLRSGQRGAPS